MTTATYPANLPANAGWFARSEAWLDQRGKGAWIAAMILGFVFFWPIGLALLAYMIWSKRMFGSSKRRHQSCRGEWEKWSRKQTAFRSSGNAAFDAYKEETIKRLMDEQDAFEAFLERLREAKDKAEFDQFMDDREKRARDERETEDA